MKICLSTPYKVINYGTKLQAYALQTFCEKSGYKVEILNFDQRSDLRLYNLIKRVANVKRIKSKLFGKNNANIKVSREIKIRRNFINSFDSKYLKTGDLIKGYKNLKKHAEAFDAFVCGSDQIWLPSNIYKPAVTLEFATKNKPRISYAPSFGVSEIPAKSKGKYRRFLKKFSAISVREQSGVDIVKNSTGLDCQLVLDPTLIIDKSDWEVLANSSIKKIDEPYIFCYFLGSTAEHRVHVKKLQEQTGYKIVTLPHFAKYCKEDDELSDYRLYDVSPCDFINLIRNAQFVCTDSFHCTVFSIIFSKDFFVYERFKKSSSQSTNTRIYNLLGIFNLQDRLVVDYDKDFSKISNVSFDLYNELKEKSQAFLLDALPNVDVIRKSYDKLPDEKCVGCTACSISCPTGAIEMGKDEMGFSVKNVDIKKCIDCGKCVAICPVIDNRLANNLLPEKAYVCKSNSLSDLEKCSSGGIFGAICDYVFERDGLVCAPIYDENFRVKHKIISKEERDKVLGSKYSESHLGDVFLQVKELLNRGRFVMFSGTPCQVKGLWKFLGKRYENLLMVDLLCYGIPSPKVFDKYLKETYPNARIESINMREKSISWESYCMKVQMADGKTSCVPKAKDVFLKSYTKGLYIRESCFSCNIKGFPRVSDITLGDCWDFDKICTESVDKNKGISLITLNSEHGIEVFNDLKDITLIDFDRAKLDSIHPYFCMSARKNANYKKFKANIDRCVLKKLVSKYTRKDLMKLKIKRMIKKMLGK